MIIAALVGALGGGALLWHGWDRPVPGRGDRPPEPPSIAAVPLLPPAETLAEIFTPCAHCHEIGQGARTMTGPPLTGIIGRKAASYPLYPYSEALRASGIVWDQQTIARFIADPQNVVPGTRMIFSGLPQKDIGALVAFIASVGRREAKPN